MRGQLSEAEILICRRKPRLTGLGRTEGSGGSAPPGSTLQCHTSGERRPGLRPGTARSHPGRPPGHAAGIGRVRGGSEQPAGPPQRRATRPAGKRRAKGRKEKRGRGSAEPAPARRLLSAAPGEATTGRSSRYLSARAPLAPQPGSSQRPPRFKPAPAHGPAAPAHEGPAAAVPLRSGCGPAGPVGNGVCSDQLRPFPAPRKAWHSRMLLETASHK